MENAERFGLWVLVVLTCVGLIVLSAIVAGELDAINRQLLVLAEDNALPADDAGATDAGMGGRAQVEISHVQVLTDSVTMTVTVKAYGAGDLLFEPPVLQSGEGTSYPATGESLAQARMAFLDLVTRGEAATRLEFAGRMSPTEGLWLVFNPNREAANVVAPRLRVAVSLRGDE